MIITNVQQKCITVITTIIFTDQKNTNKSEN
jgi:hypothetical protein